MCLSTELNEYQSFFSSLLCNPPSFYFLGFIFKWYIFLPTFFVVAYVCGCLSLLFKESHAQWLIPATQETEARGLLGPTSLEISLSNRWTVSENRETNKV